MPITPDDLIAIADDLHGIPDSESKISVPCPVHGQLAATVSLIAPEKLEAACPQCETKELWRGLVKQSATLARLWAEKSHEKEEKTKARASGPAADTRATDGWEAPPRPATHEEEPGYHREDYEVPHGASDILRRVPPQNIEAEQSFLGAILLEPSVFPEACRLLERDDFYKESHREIYGAMLAVAGTEEAIDAVTLAHILRAAHLLEAVGGAGYIAELAACVPTAAHVGSYAKIIKECAIKREYIYGLAQSLERAYNGVSVPELRRAHELIAPTINSAELPDLITRDIQILSGRDFAAYQRTVKRSWVIEGLLAKKEISLWSGKIEHGKTTLIRTLVMCVLRGELFLGRHVYPGRVLYVMLDGDGEALTFEMFNKLGIDWDNDPIDLLVDPVMSLRPNSFKQFHAKLLELRPSLVVIDPIGRFQKVEEKDGGFNSYGMTYAMAQFSELAKQGDAHFLLLHHIPRGRSDADDPASAAFGSVAIAGGCNARFSCIKKPGDVYCVVSSKGKGGGFTPFDGEQKLKKDPETEWVTLDGPWSWKDQADAIKPKVLEAINNADEWTTALELSRIVKVQRSIAGSAAKSLYKQGDIVMVIAEDNKHFFGHYGLSKERFEPKKGRK